VPQRKQFTSLFVFPAGAKVINARRYIFMTSKLRGGCKARLCYLFRQVMGA
jgi:hypothetical protein